MYSVTTANKKKTVIIPMNNQRVPLTDDEAQQIGGAIHALKEIGTTKIISPQHEAEQKGNLAFLQRILVEHADELLASWFAVHHEYEPLVGSFAALLSRATGVIQRTQAARAAAQAKTDEKPAEAPNDAPAPSNIITL
jgi:hypothetical protein